MGRKLVCDLEANSLLSGMISYKELPYRLRKDANLWVLSFLDLDTGEKFTKCNGDITLEWVKEVLKEVDVLILHNGIKYDLVVLYLFGLLEYSIGVLGEPDIIFGRECRIVDTLILSRLTWPDRPKGHSLAEWGKRVGLDKIDFRAICIEDGVIDAKTPTGSEFYQFSPKMPIYCEGDCEVTALVYKELTPQLKKQKGLGQALQQEQILANVGIWAETRGFYFGKELALGYVEDLIQRMEVCAQKVNPVLPPKPLNKGEIKEVTPPKIQLKKDGTPSSTLVNFCKKHNLEIQQDNNLYYVEYKGKRLDIPMTAPLETEGVADISNLNHVKQTLLDVYSWCPHEWRERDLTKDSKKQNLSYEKRIATLRKYVEETIEGKYKKQRLEILGIPEQELFATLSEKLKDKWPVRVPVSPLVRLSGSKELDPHLIKLGDKVEFAKDFADFLTYRHRRSSISGGDIDDVEWDPEHPNTGFLSLYREEDHRIPTACIEVGTNTFRMRHIGCANIARVTSQYGFEMRSLFRAAPKEMLAGYDFSSLENRILGNAVYNYEGGIEMAKRLIADKPDDLHSVTSRMLGITRDEAKSVNYGIAFGAQPAKLAKMLGCSLERAKEIFEGYWTMNAPLKEYKERLEAFWEKTGKKYIVALDGRRIYTRSKHSLINAITQANGAIFGKYVAIFIMEELSQKYDMNPFSCNPPINLVITYHDEQIYNISDMKVDFKTFKTEEEGRDFIKNWKGGHQIGGLSHGKTWYVPLPNDLSIAVENSIKRAEELLKLKVPMGFEFKLGSSWASIH